MMQPLHAPHRARHAYCEVDTDYVHAPEQLLFDCMRRRYTDRQGSHTPAQACMLVCGLSLGCIVLQATLSASGAATMCATCCLQHAAARPAHLHRDAVGPSSQDPLTCKQALRPPRHLPDHRRGSADEAAAANTTPRSSLCTGGTNTTDMVPSTISARYE